MSQIGIIANPASGKDIRRLVADASSIDNREKVHIVRRVLRGVAAVGTERVFYLREPYGICPRAAQELTLPFPVEPISQRTNHTQMDSFECARIMTDLGVDVFVILGGDGTHRIVAKSCPVAPIVGVSTGTNNVWPTREDGTLSGLAAALVANGIVPLTEAAHGTKRFDVVVDGRPADMALVDVGVYDSRIVGARAIWEVSRIQEIVSTQTDAGVIGLSSIGGSLPRRPETAAGVYARTGAGGTPITVPIAPGTIARLSIVDHCWMDMGQAVSIVSRPSTLALDGERELTVRDGQVVAVQLTDAGPRRVDVLRTLQSPAARRYFSSSPTTE